MSSTRCSAVKKSVVEKMRHQRISQEGLSVDVQRHLMVIKDNEEYESNARLVSLFAKRFGTGQRSFLGLGSEKSGLSVQIVHKVNGTERQRR